MQFGRLSLIEIVQAKTCSGGFSVLYLNWKLVSMENVKVPPLILLEKWEVEENIFSALQEWQLFFC